MSWAGQTVQAVHATFEGVVDELVLGVGALDAVGGHEEVRPSRHASRCFEVGSIGKTFTALVLARDVVDGRISLDDRIGEWLDAGDNGDITLLELATHTSGLPRLAPNAFEWDGFDERHPYAGFSAAMAEEAVREVDRTEDGVAYSNFGYQLLGLVLERIGGAPIGERLRSLVFDPLGMADAGVTGDCSAGVTGYDELGEPTSAWAGLPLPGPGGYEATVTDMVSYAAAVLDPPTGPVGEAIELAVGPHVEDGDGRVGLAWQHHPTGLVWHNGGTGGFHSMLAIDRGKRRAVVALANHTDLENLDPAIMRAALDRDLDGMRPEPVDDSWVDVARQIADAVIANDWATIRARSDETLAAALTNEVLQSGWDQVFGPRGEHQSTSALRATRSDGTVRVTFRLDHVRGAGRILVGLDDTRRVNGLRIF